jgi:transcriptional regulator with XRE-family HTH domain
MQTIGERLEEARKRKGVSIREAAEATKIRGDYLHKFENNQFDLKLPEIYVRGFLRTYALFLKLPGDKVVNDYKGLGIGEAPKNSRGLNRESYGRMDLSVATAKSPTTREAPAAPSAAAAAMAPTGDTPPPSGPSDNNPATFRPRAGAGPQVDQALIIKGAIALGGLIVVLVLVFVLVRAFSGGTPKQASAASNQIWVQAQAGEPTITLYALDNVSVSFQQLDTGTLLFKGNLARGESRVIPRRGKIRIAAEPSQGIEMEINGVRYPMPPNESKADIAAPTAPQPR